MFKTELSVNISVVLETYIAKLYSGDRVVQIVYSLYNKYYVIVFIELLNIQADK